MHSRKCADIRDFIPLLPESSAEENENDMAALARLPPDEYERILKLVDAVTQKAKTEEVLPVVSAPPPPSPSSPNASALPPSAPIDCGGGIIPADEILDTRPIIGADPARTNPECVPGGLLEAATACKPRTYYWAEVCVATARSQDTS